MSDASLGEKHLQDRSVSVCASMIDSPLEPQLHCVRKASKKPRVLAIKAAAHTLARACYHLIKDGGHFDVKRAFG